MKGLAGGSIFVKLLAAYAFAFVFIIGGAAAVWYLSASSPNVQVSLRNVGRYAESLVKEIGTPPDPAKAEKLATETGLEIAVFGPGLAWSSRGEKDETGVWPLEGKGALRRFLPWTREFVLDLQVGDYHYRFTDFHADHHVSALIWLLLIGIVPAALAASYGLVRHFLKPLRGMNRLALEFGVTDWKSRINPAGKDELANLGRAMDSMADRLEKYVRSMHELLAAISHELRSPLTRMQVALEFLDDPKLRSSLQEEIRALDRLTGNLLERERYFIQPGALVLEPVRLGEWFETVQRQYRWAEALEAVFDGQDRIFFLDRGRMDLIVHNLLENAFRYAPGSRIVLRLTAADSGEGFVLEVTDEGPGMPEETLERLGEPFLRAGPAGAGNSAGGFGLGLSIVKLAAEAQGAVLRIENRRPRGLSAILRFEKVPRPENA